MAQSPCSRLLGEILREADLITEAQIQVALQDQQYSPLPIGEILVVRGWLQQETADFFAESWPRMVKTRDRRPLGYYLQQAYLLQEDQVNLILEEQRKLGVRFGSVAVLKGWVKQKTLDYFLEHLMPEAITTSAFQGRNTQSNIAFVRDTRLQTETGYETKGMGDRRPVNPLPGTESQPPVQAIQAIIVDVLPLTPLPVILETVKPAPVKQSQPKVVTVLPPIPTGRIST
ncbi:hypothetical protein NON20_17835 [Synechocystis sp. B12]|nr:hypothetical protein NON20_17835 [Synechocystis sp. B12]